MLCFDLLNQFLLPPHKIAMLQEAIMFSQGAFSKFMSFSLSSIHQIIYLQFVSPDITWHFDQQHTIISTRRDPSILGNRSPRNPVHSVGVRAMGTHFQWKLCGQLNQ